MIKLKLIFISFCFTIPCISNAQILGGCKFDSQTLAFAGSVDEQLQCLLKKIKPKGAGANLQIIPEWLKNNASKPVEIKEKQIINYLNSKQISLSEISVVLGYGNASSLKYFVIHDTSWPEEIGEFPSDINEASYRGNNFSMWNGDIKDRVHAIITRDGQSKIFNDWQSQRKKSGVKIETNNRIPQSRKVLAHVENVQPRIKPSNTFAWIAPEPGFSPRQEERLALLYVMASYRAGHWLIPAYHFNIDQGLPDGHDDPQNTDLQNWVTKISSISEQISSMPFQ